MQKIKNSTLFAKTRNIKATKKRHKKDIISPAANPIISVI
jgi:hypothetical protein